MTQTFAKNIRVTPEQWDRIEKVAAERNISANQLVIEPTMEALDRREWPRIEAEVHVARASLFVALVLQRDLIAAGREDEVEEIQRFISTNLPEPEQDSEPLPAAPSGTNDRRSLIIGPHPLGPEHVGMIERTFRYSWFLATLKCDEMLDGGRKDELDRMLAEAREFQADLVKGKVE